MACGLEIFAARAGFLFIAIGLPGLFDTVVKRLIGRGRPELFDSVGTLGFHPGANSFVYESFPSGHSTQASAFYGALLFIFLAVSFDILLLHTIIPNYRKLLETVRKYKTGIITKAQNK